jgi:hypothetical protein
MELLVRSVARTIMMHFNAGIGLIKPIKQRVQSSRQLQQLMGTQLILIGTLAAVQLITLQVILTDSQPKNAMLEEIKSK